MIHNRHLVENRIVHENRAVHDDQSEQRFRSLLENTSDWIWELDSELRFVYVSPRVQDLLGYASDEVLGRTPFDFMPYTEAVRLRERLQGLIQDPRPFQALEISRLHRDGSLRVTEASCVPILGADGRFAGLRGMERDITARKKVEQELQAALVRSAQEKARSEAIIAAIGEGLVIVDRDFRILYQNQILRRLGSDALEDHCYLVYAGRDTICDNCPVARTFQDGEIHTTEKSASQGGSTVYREITASPLQDEQGNIVAGIELVRDITERKLAELALKESERQMKEVQRIAQLGSWQLDYDTGELFWSDETYRILGWEPQQVPASYSAFLGVVHPEDRALVESSYSDSVRTGSDGYEIEHRIVRQGDGAIRHIHQKCEHLKNQPGKVVRSYGMIHDVTQRKQAERHIRRLNADLSARAMELERANKDLEAFSYTVSHDLRGPLTNINSYCQAIAELDGDKLDSQCKGFMRSVLLEIKSMDGLITSLLNLSRYAHVKLHNSRVELSGLAKAIAAELQIHDPERRVSFDIADGISASGDERLLGMALMNLLGNAWKFSAKEKDSVIRFGMTRIEGRRVYFVSDNGIGFDMDDHDKLFAVFQRLHRSDDFEGFGIGLATVRRIIERHNGRIWAEGEPGQGATFYFTLHEKPQQEPVLAPACPACPA
jgi:PAS domain S-box-containing protein